MHMMGHIDYVVNIFDNDDNANNDIFSGNVHVVSRYI